MINKTNILIIILALFYITPAHAQDNTNTTTTYAPEYCAFSAAFPEEPHITKHCEGEPSSNCYNLISYTKVFEGLSAAINVEIICNPSDKTFYDNFTQDVMEKTVKAMTQDTIIEAYEVKSSEGENYRQSGILGKGRKGLYDTIYIAQIWLTENSIMSVQAEMSGEQNDDADLVFADILRSIGHTGEMQKKSEEVKNENKGAMPPKTESSQP